jgi:preprotein translocase subunit SecE
VFFLEPASLLICLSSFFPYFYLFYCPPIYHNFEIRRGLQTRENLATIAPHLEVILENLLEGWKEKNWVKERESRETTNTITIIIIIIIISFVLLLLLGGKKIVIWPKGRHCNHIILLIQSLIFILCVCLFAC